MQKTTLTLKPVAPFDFASTAYSHGWVVLLPNAWDEDARVVSRVQQLASGRVVRLEITGKGSVRDSRISIGVDSDKELTPVERREVRTAVSRMFRLDEDLSEFYRLCKRKGGAWKQAANGTGRLLRSPTVFEDLVKTICTTNIQWGGTKRLVENLVNGFGARFADGGARAFPTPEAIAGAPLKRFSEKARLGYRNEYVHILARCVAKGELNLETFLDKAILTIELRKMLLDIKGVGNYAAATMLMLLGRYDELAMDAVFRQFVSEKYFRGKRVSDQKAAAVYDGWGEWKYLAYWFDIWQGFNEAL